MISSKLSFVAKVRSFATEFTIELYGKLHCFLCSFLKNRTKVSAIQIATRRHVHFETAEDY